MRDLTGWKVVKSQGLQGQLATIFNQDNERVAVLVWNNRTNSWDWSFHKANMWDWRILDLQPLLVGA